MEDILFGNDALHNVIQQNSLKFKQLNAINKITNIIREAKNTGKTLKSVCNILPSAFEYEEDTVARIKYEGKEYTSTEFEETRWILKQTFETVSKKKGAIDIFFLKQFPDADEGPFKKHDREFIENIDILITGYLNSVEAKDLHQIKNKLDLFKDDNTISQQESTFDKSVKIITAQKSVEETLQQLVINMPQSWQYPNDAIAKISYDGKTYLSSNKKYDGHTKYMLVKSFETIDRKQGVIEFYYLDTFPEKIDTKYITSEKELINNMANLIVGFINIFKGMDKFAIIDDEVKKIIDEHTERQKELACINKTSKILQDGRSIDKTLQNVVNNIPAGWQYPESTCARITYGSKTFISPNFKETKYKQSENIKTIDNRNCIIEIFYLKEFPELDEGPFLKEERNLLKNLSTLISGYINILSGVKEVYSTQKSMQKIIAEQKERLKELSCINQTSEIIRSTTNLETGLQKIAFSLPAGWQYPEYTSARIVFDKKEFRSKNFKPSKWVQKRSFVTIDEKIGEIEIYYSKQFPIADEGPFLKEERDLINNIANLITGFLNGLVSKTALEKQIEKDRLKEKYQITQESLLTKRKLLQNFLHKNNYDRDVYHDLMPFKVKEILLVANMYDAFSIEREGKFSDYILGEYYQLNLTSVPRITGVSSYEEAFEKLYSKPFDLIILMVGVDKKTPLDIAKEIKQEFMYIPVFMLLNNNTDIKIFEPLKSSDLINNIFVWNGDSRIFFTMVKHLEDKVNLENDTEIGFSRVILLVEDSAKYYSRYLPLLYRSVMEQTRRIIDDVSTMDELYKVLRLRVRPKLLLASNYEEAINIYKEYKDYFLCLISDVKFKKNGKLNDKAGFELARYIKNEMRDLPIVIQSSDESNKEKAQKIKCSFIYKNSETLAYDIENVIKFNMGFGDFIYKDTKGNQIAVAHNLEEFEERLKTIPDDTLVYHASRNHFSLWLTARGEIQVAKAIAPKQVNDFKSAEGLRNYLIEEVAKQKYEKNKGKIVEFDPKEILNESNILLLSPGSLGGKGRGLAFIHTLIYNFNISDYFTDINIRAPRTFIIGTDEFDTFLEKNKLREKVYQVNDSKAIKKMFLEAELSADLIKKLRIVLEKITKPLAIRSSGLFEDSLMQPFAGIFETYILPNCDKDIEIRLKNITDAIKLVYASIFSEKARGYINAINYKIEEEKMAVVIQELVGNKYNNYYYPHFSGVAQSYNYYPFAHMEPEDGFAVLAVGLGTYVVEGEKAFRFCPKYPNLQNLSNKDLFLNSQLYYYAVNLKNRNLDLSDSESAGLIKLDIDDAEMHGTVKHLASVYDPDNNTITPGLDKPGPRIVNFADILKYNYIPLSETLTNVLDVVKEAMGSSVEIEFAVDLNKDSDYKASFYLLQIKPLIGNAQDYKIDLSELKKMEDQIVLYTENGMGNGLIDTIKDVIFVDIKTFDKTRTTEIANEINEFNKLMIKEKRQYILLGPGRWGTRDKWIGIPVTWPQISNAKIIVETSLDDFPLDASAGSHFFHNVTSMNVGYFSVQHSSRSNIINWNIFYEQKTIRETKYIKHIQFKNNLQVRMDGKKRISVITYEK